MSSFSALFLEKLEPSLTLKNDNLLPGASGGPYTFNVWKSRIRKRNQRMMCHTAERIRRKSPIK